MLYTHKTTKNTFKLKKRLKSVSVLYVLDNGEKVPLKRSMQYKKYQTVICLNRNLTHVEECDQMSLFDLL
jgi:ACT domain-containing protein